ncbi:MAG TPA: molecular chaperone TorD family protein [Bryobacteraceae bacterium]|nr:molecular chaperone TorD family protein [Bryobacteraceae bacterium]
MAIYSLFAGILDYPAQPIAQVVNDCSAELAIDCPEARQHLTAFLEGIAGKSLGQLQEIYTNAFDLRPDCTPNLGYHLFGDDGRRGLFLAELKGRMESSGIAPGCELPDHISLLLRYMQQNEQERCAVIEDCMLPAVSRMADVLDSSENPYKHALRALLSLLQRQREGANEADEAMKV